MRRPAIVLALSLVLAACTGGEDGGDAIDVEPTAIVVPEGQACTDQLRVPAMPSVSHIAPDARATYSTNPPTSGEHAGPVPTGVYQEPLPDEATVHNLEHGHVIVHHDGLPEETLTQIEATVRADPVQMLMLPRPDMDHVLALTAWRVIQVCDELPEDPIETVRAFVRANRDSGLAPESVP